MQPMTGAVVDHHRMVCGRANQHMTCGRSSMLLLSDMLVHQLGSAQGCDERRAGSGKRVGFVVLRVFEAQQKQ